MHTSTMNHPVVQKNHNPTPSVDTPHRFDGKLIRGHTSGPWDASEYNDTPIGKHRSGGTLHLQSLALPIPYGCVPTLDRIIDTDDKGNETPGTPIAVHLTLAATDAVAVFSVAASPKSETSWQTHYCPSMEQRFSDAPGITDVRIINGTFGQELLVSAPHQQSLTLGVDGPRWTLIATIYAPTITSEVMAIVDSILTDAIVNRGQYPYCPHEPLPMSPIAPPAR